MNQSPVNPYLILTAITLFFLFFSGLILLVYRIIKFALRIHGKFKKISIESSNDNECSDL